MTADLPLSPWIDLPSQPPFVLPDDAVHVAAYNRLYGGDPRRRLQVERLPEAVLGRWDAPVVVLTGPPPVLEGDDGRADDPAFVERWRRALADPPHTHAVLADPDAGASHGWWRRATRSLREQVGDDAVARGLLTVTFTPYAAEDPGAELLLMRLPSQAFGFARVREALRRGALVVLASHRAAWFGAVPELAGHDGLMRLHATRSLRITPNTVDGFERIAARLSEASTAAAVRPEPAAP
jgi:hypothetical protein